MHFVLGIDAGATSTTAAVVDEMGTVRGVGHAGRANILIDGVEAGVNNICAAADSALLFAQARHEELSAVCIGAAGVGDEGDPIRDLLLREASQRLRLSCPIHIDHDAAVAHAGALSGKAGVIIIAGTGAIAFGRADDGRIARADGWGHWVGDEGGGFWMGMEALRIWMRAYDGRSHWTALAECIPRALNVDSPRELVVALSSGEISKDEIARLAFVIAEAAGNGDTIARQIIERAACKLAESAIAVARNLGFDCPTISYAGGIFRIGELILEPLHAELMTHLPSAHFTAPYMAPVMGAALLALRMLEDATLIKVD
ncbi:MAG TPA: hypothetical protein EYP10_00280, partial [Armatimonadetes bacterium]|nr:hypothetical protein [Armatimonadota bacterium]